MIWVIPGAAALLAVVFVLACYAAYRVCFFSPEPHQNDPHELPGAALGNELLGENIKQNVTKLETVPCEDVFIQSRDGLRLHGRFYGASKDAPTVICFHGYRSIGLRDFCIGAQLFLNAGCSVLLVDHRAHGGSEGKTICFGIRERYDALDWTNYVIERVGVRAKILLVGLSMGAATVLMASSLPLPENVVGIGADSPYSDVMDIIVSVARKWHAPAPLTRLLCGTGARLFGHFSPNETSTLRAVRQAKVPVLIIHGEADNLVPYEMGKALFDACASEKTFLSVPGADHCMSGLVAPEKYNDALLSFLRRCTEVRHDA